MLTGAREGLRCMSNVYLQLEPRDRDGGQKVHGHREREERCALIEDGESCPRKMLYSR